MNGCKYFAALALMMLFGTSVLANRGTPLPLPEVKRDAPFISQAEMACAVPRGTKLLRQFEAKVTRVQDGDTALVVQVPNNRESRLRLAGIDAPELAQPWGRQSQRALQRLIGGQNIRVLVTDRDRYGRLVALLCANGRYVNAEMTKAGHAWAFDRYMPDPRIRAGQNAARRAKIGLWSQPEKDQLPPATWRQKYQGRPQ